MGHRNCGSRLWRLRHDWELVDPHQRVDQERQHLIHSADRRLSRRGRDTHRTIPPQVILVLDSTLA